MPDLVPNLRDVGGLPAGPTVIRPGRLLRSAAPFADDVAPPGVTWPPAVVVDLRSPMETHEEHPLVSLGSRVEVTPLLAALRPGVRLADSLTDLYAIVLRDSADRLVDITRTVSAAPGAALVHCAAGKDRTGIVVALLLRLVGVDREVVLADYLRTADHLADVHARLEASPGHEHRVHLPPEFLAVPAEPIGTVLDAWDAHDHGVEGWFRDAGGTSADLAALRGHLLGVPA